MRAWLLRLLGADRPPPPRVGELAARLADVELELQALGGRVDDAVERINARITNRLRKPAQDQDAPGDAEAAPSPQVSPIRRIRRNY